MSRTALGPALERIVGEEAGRLREEFGAGAALFVRGQLAEAVRSRQTGAAAFWSAVLEDVLRPRAATPTVSPNPWIRPAIAAARPMPRAVSLSADAGRRARIARWLGRLAPVPG